MNLDPPKRKCFKEQVTEHIWSNTARFSTVCSETAQLWSLERICCCVIQCNIKITKSVEHKCFIASEFCYQKTATHFSQKAISRPGWCQTYQGRCDKTGRDLPLA